MVLGILILSAVLIELFFTPRLDKTSEGDILLWYNKGLEREYVILWKSY